MNNAYLHVDGFKFPITYFDFNLRQFKGTNNRPLGKVHGGEFSFTLDFDNKNAISLIAWMISPNMQKDGYIEIQDFANSSIAFKLEFANAYATAQEFYYSAFSNLPLQTNVTITAGALRFDREVPFFQTWNPNNSFTNQSATVVITNNSPNIQSFTWFNINTEEHNISEISYNEKVNLRAKIENSDSGTATIKIRKRDGSEFIKGQKELTFTEAVNEEGIVETTPQEIEEVWENFKTSEIDELVAEVEYNGYQKTSASLQITPIPKAIVEFRPSKKYNGEYGFDYLREEKKKDHTTYEDILGTNSTVKNPNTGLKVDKFTKYPTGQKYKDLISNYYGKIQLPWHKDNNGNPIDYIQSWLTIYPNEKATLSLQIETLVNPNKEDFTFDYDNTIFNLSTTTIPAQGKGKKRLHDHLTIECLKEFNTDQTIKVMFGNRVLGQLNILKNAKAHRKVANVVFVRVKTNLKGTGKGKKGSTQNKKGICEDEMLYKFLQQGYIKLENDDVEFDLTQLDPKTKKLKYPNFNINFTLLDNNQTPPEKIVNKYHNTTNRKLVDFMETEFNKTFPTYANHFKVFFFGDRGGKKIEKAVWGLGGYAKGFNTKSVIVFNGSNETTVTHELLHAIGLKHSFSNSGQFSYQKGETYNIMDYSHQRKYGNKNRNQIWYWQMKQLWKNSDLKPE